MGTRRLLERTAELTEIGAALGRATSGAGETVLIEGAAGSGKSTLLAAATQEAAGRAHVLRAGGSELERGFAFGAIRQLFEPLVRRMRDVERRRLFAGSAAPAEWLVATRGGEGDRLRAQAGFAMLQAIYWVVASLAAGVPIVLAVDDLHWVDELSLQALAFLAQRLSDLPVALLMTMRPSEPDSPAALLDTIRSLPGATRVTPPPLSRDAVASIVRERVPDANADLCEAFHDASGGNPLYLRELLLSTVATGAVRGPSTADEVRRAAVPALGDRLVRRIAPLAPEAETLATSMALVGDGASLRLAADLAGTDPDLAARIARRLTEIEVLAQDDPVAFAHPVLRRSLYDRLPATDRERMHADAARQLRDAGAPPEAVAAHVAALPPSRSPEVAASLLEAARVAISRAAPSAAIPLLRRALDEGAPDLPRAILLYELGRAEMTVRDPAALGHLRTAVELADDPRVRAVVAIDLTELLAAIGSWEEMLATLSRATRELGDSEPELQVELQTLRALTTAFDPRGVDDFDRNRARYEELSRGSSWPAHALAAVLSNIALLRCEGQDRVMEHARQALSEGRLVRERGGAGWAAPHILPSLVLGGEYELGLEVSDEIAAVARREGSMLGTVSALVGRGMTYSRTGDLVAAEAVLRSVLDATRDSGMTLWLASTFQFFIDTLLERPQLADAVAFAESIELDPAFAETGGGAQLLEARGRLRLALNDRQRGLADLRACAAVYEGIGLGPTWAPWRSVLALAIRDEEPSHAARLVADDVQLAEASGVPEVHGTALRYAGILAGGAEGIEFLRESVWLLAPTRARLEHARSLVELGAALRRGQRRGEAREPLAAGLEQADACGADRLVARAREELEASGARPRRIARSGLDALTPSELRVARRAAEGRSNLEIAQELYVTTKTVEAHLSAAYAKLGLAGRGARDRLAELLS